MARKSGHIVVGVGGWTYAPWRGAFFPADLPQKRELEYASRKLTSIEINATFYRTQTPATFIKWRDETPGDFCFSVKAPRYATMRKTAHDARESIAHFFDSGVTELQDKLGPVLWQFAPTRKFDAEFFAAFVSLLPKEWNGRMLRHAIEVRNESFRCAEFVDLALKNNVAIVVAGDSKYPLIADVTADFVYARIQGTSEAEPRGYSLGAMDAWAARARTWASGGAPADLAWVANGTPKKAPRDVFLYVISGFKASNPAAATALIERIGDPGGRNSQR